MIKLTEREKKRKNRKKPVLTGVVIVLVAVSFFLNFAGQWYVDVYGNLGFDSVIYTIFSDLGGVESNLIESFLEAVLPKTVSWSALVCIPLFFYARKKIVLKLFDRFSIRIYPVNRILAACVGIILSVSLLSYAAVNVELVEYIKNLAGLTMIYQTEYADPKTTQVTFPEEKRNLIYIYLESMETTFLSKEEGGGISANVIPEISTLAQENVNFSPTDGVGGLMSTSGTTWTIGALIGHSAGVPLKTPPDIGGNDYGKDGIFLPGLTTITDILCDNGYYQVLMVGSDAYFGGRKQFYLAHGMDTIYDYYTAIEDGIIPEDHYVWWGMEDKYLYEYAKQEITEISAKDQPFAFTMLTVDTHHIGGYVCELCGNERSEQYENVYSCASKQVNEFVEWIQKQDFYENTTVVIVGDHPSMDADYFTRNMDGTYIRRVYNCIINSAVEPVKEKNREACTLDMFPTTLAAMGCTIKGERLGLGTNLFSDRATLLEEFGWEKFDGELSKNSPYYYQYFYAQQQ